MMANTIQEMVSLLEDTPLDTPLQDSWGNRYVITSYEPHEKHSDIPVVMMNKLDSSCDYSDTVLSFLSLLIDISMDKRFNGFDCKLQMKDVDYRPGRKSMIKLVTKGKIPIFQFLIEVS